MSLPGCPKKYQAQIPASSARRTKGLMRMSGSRRFSTRGAAAVATDAAKGAAACASRGAAGGRRAGAAGFDGGNGSAAGLLETGADGFRRSVPLTPKSAKKSLTVAGRSSMSKDNARFSACHCCSDSHRMRTGSSPSRLASAGG